MDINPDIHTGWRPMSYQIRGATSNEVAAGTSHSHASRKRQPNTSSYSQDGNYHFKKANLENYTTTLHQLIVIFCRLTSLATSRRLTLVGTLDAEQGGNFRQLTKGGRKMLRTLAISWGEKATTDSDNTVCLARAMLPVSFLSIHLLLLLSLPSRHQQSPTVCPIVSPLFLP